MDRDHLIDRLPTDRIRSSLPGVDADATDEFDAEDGPDEFDLDTTDEPPAAEPATTGLGDDVDAATDAAESDADPTADDEEAPSRREQARTLLLGVSLAGAGLAVVAALVRRLLGGRTDEAEDVEPADEGLVSDEAAAEPTPDTPAPDAEGVAATIGLAFLLVVRALLGEDDEPESSTA